MLTGLKCVFPSESNPALDASGEFRRTGKPSEMMFSMPPGMTRAGAGCRMLKPEVHSWPMYLKKAAAKLLASALAGRVTPVKHQINLKAKQRKKMILP